jgi:Zn-dependent protease
MLRSWKLGTAFGIGIYVHWSFLLLPAWALLRSLGQEGLTLADYVVTAGFALAALFAVFGCVVLHELGHALTARRFGIPTRDITLYPIGGVARLERMSEKPWEEFWIAVAGPAVNLLIAGLLLAALVVAGPLTQVVALPALGLVFLYYLMMINVFLALFNLLPAFPMDGGRVLRALLALRLGHLRATQAAVNVGLVVAVLMGSAGLVYFHNPMLILIAAFVFFAGQQELAAVRYREAQRWTGNSWEGPFSSRLEEEYDDRPSEPVPPPPPKVYLWDPNTRRWVEQRPLRPIPPVRGY